MTPDLDQTLSLKAALHDKISPALDKIRRGIRTTRETFSDMVSNVSQKGSEAGASTGEMESKVNDDLKKIQDGLKETSGAFDQFSGTAKSSTEKVGKAVEDAMYTKGAEDRLEGLDKDLGKLDNTFKSMASKQRAVSGKARGVSATASDNINKKVIPAFQELHATLDDYPDMLDDINRLEQDRMRVLEEGQGFLGRVSERIEGAGEGLRAASDELKFGLRDMAALINAGILGTTGARVQEMQTGAARIAGAGAFEQTPAMLQAATEQAQTTMDVVEPFYNSLLELRSVSDEAMPSLIAEMVNLSKVTGDSGDEIAQLYDKMVNLGSIKGEGFLELQDNMKYFQETTRATWDDMSASIGVASSTMLDFSEDARRAYAKSTLAASAAAKNMGLSATTPQEVIENLLDNPEAMAKMQGIISTSGQQVDLQALIREGRDEEAFDAITKSIRDMFGELNMRDMAERKAIMEMTAGLGLGKEELRRIFEGKGMTGAGEGGTAAELGAKAAVEAQGTIMEDAVKIRGTLAERAEQTMGLTQSMLIEPGRKLAEGVANAGQVFNEHVLAPAVRLEHAADALSEGAVSTTVAVIGMEEVLSTGFKSLLSAGKAAGIVPDSFEMGLLEKLAVTGGAGYAGYKLVTAEPGAEPQFFQPGGVKEDWATTIEDQMVRIKEGFAAGGTKEEMQKALASGDTAEMEKALSDMQLNMRDMTERKAMLEMTAGLGLGKKELMGLFGRKEEGPISPEEQKKMLEEAVPSKLETATAGTPLGLFGQVPDMAKAGLEFGVVKSANKINEIKSVFDLLFGDATIADMMSSKKKDLEAEVAGAVEPGAILAEAKDVIGEKQLNTQEGMLAELRTLTGILKQPANKNQGVKPVYTPGMDRSREYLELDKGY